MNTRMVVLALATIGTVVGSGWASAQPKGERVTVKGEVVEMWCYLEAGDRGAAKKACATECAKAGNPIALIDTNGILYVTAGLKSHQAAQELLLNKMSEQVTVSGTLVRKAGIRMLYIESVR